MTALRGTHDHRFHDRPWDEDLRPDPTPPKPAVTPVSTPIPSVPRTRSGSGLSVRISTSMPAPVTDDPANLSLAEIKRRYNQAMKERDRKSTRLNSSHLG